MASKRTPSASAERPVRAAIYLRVSTDEQVQGYGLDVQEDRTRAMIAAKGWQYTGKYADEGISGTKGATERAGLARLLADAQAREIDAVVVLALDRLGRKTKLVLDLVDELAAAGAQLVSCKESLDTSTPQGAFVLTMFAALAELERGVIVQRTTDGRNKRGRRDGDKGGRLPLGYRRPTDEGPVLVDELTAPIVRRIFKQRALKAKRDPRGTLQAIADGLNADGITTQRGKQWHPSDVRAILQRESVYRGSKRGESSVRWPRLL